MTAEEIRITKLRQILRQKKSPLTRGYIKEKAYINGNNFQKERRLSAAVFRRDFLYKGA